MQAGVRVEVRAGGGGNSRTGVVLSRDTKPPLEVDRYLVRLDGEQGATVLPLEQLVYLEEKDDEKSEGGTDDMMYANGHLCFCSKHRLEICGSCGYNFRMQNLMSELYRKLSYDQAEELVSQIERAMDRAGCAVRKAPLPGEPMVTKPVGGGRSDLLDGSVLPRNTNPSSLGMCHPTQVSLCFVYNHRHFPVASPLLKEMRTTIEEIATFTPSAPPSRSMIGLQDGAQSEVLWICIDSLRTLSTYPGGAVPLIAVHWQHGTAADPMRTISYIDQGMQPTEFRCSVEEIRAFRELLTRNGERMDPAYSRQIKAKYLPRDWNVSALAPIVTGKEGTVASLVVPLPGSPPAAGAKPQGSATTVSTPAADACDYCHTSDMPVRRCTKCKVAKYCSRECQTLAWKQGHKRDCKPPSSS